MSEKQNEAREVAIELLSCPFCGGEPMLRNDEPDYWYVSCNNCVNQTTHFCNGRDVVIERWNTRHDAATAHHAAEIERLIEANHRLQVALDSDYCETCAERNGIFKHLESSALAVTPEVPRVYHPTQQEWWNGLQFHHPGSYTRICDQCGATFAGDTAPYHFVRKCQAGTPKGEGE